MAIQYVGGQTFFAQTGNVTFNLTGGIASTPATGDLVLISYAEASSGDVSLASAVTPSLGYTQVAELFANDSNDANLAVFYKVMGANPNTSVSVKTADSSQNGAACVVHVFRGVDTTTPLDVTSTTATNIDTGNTNPAAITPATSGNVIIPFGCYAEGNVVRSYTAPSYLSNFRQTNRVGTTYGIVTGSGHVTGQSAGVSYDPATWLANSDSSSYSWCAVTLALRPASDPVITGTASSTFAVTGASSGAVSISGASSGDMAISGASIASVLAAASASGTIDLSGSASGGGAKMLVAAGSIDIAGSATATVQLSAVASGQIDLTGSAQGGVAIVAASSGQIGITGAADGEVSYNTGEASGTLAFTGAAIGAIYVQGSVSGAISFSLASYGKHLWLQQPPTDETWSVQAANSEIWQPVSGSGTAWE